MTAVYWMVIILVNFQGTEIIGLAASESENPEVTIPAAVRSVSYRIIALYVIPVGLLEVFFAIWGEEGVEGFQSVRGAGVGTELERRFGSAEPVRWNLPESASRAWRRSEVVTSVWRERVFERKTFRGHEALRAYQAVRREYFEYEISLCY